MTAAHPEPPLPDLLADAGYVALPGFLAGERLAEARRLVDELLGKGHDGACQRPNNTLVPLRWIDALVSLVLGDEASMGRLAAVADGRDLRWISGYVSVKDPHSPPLWWHQDWWCWDHPVSFQSEAAQVAVLCYLSDTTVEGGALRVLPGSHTRSVPVHAVLPEAHSDASVALDPHHPAMSDQPGQRTLAVRAGDAVLMDYRLLHGTHANHLAYRRDCLLLNFAPAWQELPDEIRAHLISHPALPSGDEPCPHEAWHTQFLPTFAGAPKDLVLNRNAPASFSVHESPQVRS